MVLLFYPSDFTYVDPTELLAFDAAADVFAKLETEAWHCSHCDSAKSSRLLPQFSTVSFVLCDAYCTLTTIALRVVAASTHAVGMCFRPFVSLSCVPRTAAPIRKTNETEFREAKPNLRISASPNTVERTNQQRIPSLYTAAAHWLDSTVLALASAATPTAVHSPKQSGWSFIQCALRFVQHCLVV